MPHAMTGALLLALVALPASAAPDALPAAPPVSAASTPMPAHSMATPMLRHRPKVFDHLVDINSAGRKELMTLPGVGPAEAERIVAHRPYLTKTELVTKQVLLVGPYLSLKDQVVAMQKLKPKGNG